MDLYLFNNVENDQGLNWSIANMTEKKSVFSSIPLSRSAGILECTDDVILLATYNNDNIAVACSLVIHKEHFV
jgi:hypothetical protein